MSHLPFLTVDALDHDGNKTTATSPPANTQSKPDMSPAHSTSTSTSVDKWIKCPLAVVITLATSAGLYSAVAELTGFELATISKSVNDSWQIGALLAWRIAEVYIGWSHGFDYWDAASAALLTAIPYHSLIYLFYGVLPVSVLISLAIDLASSTLPFFLLRPLAVYNSPPGSAPAATRLSTSKSVQLYVSLFLSVLYAATIYTSLQTFLPSYIVSTFDIRTLEPVRAASLPILLAAALPLGNAAKDFLYVPSTYLEKAGVEEKQFDPHTATLAETFAWNVGLSGWGEREDVLITRTFLLVLLTLGSSVAKIYATVQGAELLGVLSWGGVFATAGVLGAAGLGYVADV